MSDSSEDEDLSRFKEAVDNSFNKLIENSRAPTAKGFEQREVQSNTKSERYLEVSSHYNDVKVPDELQKQIGAKVSYIIQKNIEFVDIKSKKIKKPKKVGGVKLFKDSKDFLSCEEVRDTSTEIHNRESKKVKRKRRTVSEDEEISENEKIAAATINGDYVLSKDEIKHWKSRRKEKLFKYKKNGYSNVLTAIE